MGITTTKMIEMKMNNEKITVLTAYDYTTAHLLDMSGIDCILVGDSLGMTILGYEDTLSVTLEDMIHHTKAVKRGVKNAMVVCDMPFLSYHISPEDSVRNAGRIIKETGAHAVKLEGGKAVFSSVEAIVKAQIPVMGHLGLTPQSVNMFGGFKVQGKTEDQAKALIEDAKALEALGCFAIVLECIPDRLAELVSRSIGIPTIGIGAGAGCDGQVLVVQDMLGLYDKLQPKFVKQYAQLGVEMSNAVKAYCTDVKLGLFPEEKHAFKIKDDIIEKLY